jgi:hypothetical protein
VHGLESGISLFSPQRALQATPLHAASGGLAGRSFQLDVCEVFQPAWCRLGRYRSSSEAYERGAVARFSEVTWLASYSGRSLAPPTSRFKAS